MLKTSSHQESISNRLKVWISTKEGGFFSLIILSIVGMINSILGQAIIAARLGLGVEYDSYLAGLVLPQVLVIVAVGYFGLNFLPIYSKSIREDGHIQQSEFVYTTLLYILIFSFSIIALTFIFSNLLFPIFLPGFEQKSLKLVRTIYFITAPSFVFASINSILELICQYRKKFVKAKILHSLCNPLPAIALLFFNRQLGVYSLAVGFLVMHVLQTLYLSSEVLGYYSFSIKINNKRAVSVLKNSALLSSTGMLSKITPLLEKVFASMLAPGAISALGFSNRMVRIPSGLISGNLITIVYPDYARASAKNNIHELMSIYKKSVAAVSFFCIPTAAYMGATGFQWIRILFERGRFSQESSLQVYHVLLAFMAFFILNGICALSARIFYAQNKNTLPIIINISNLIIYAACGYFLSRLFGVVGLAVSFSLVFIYSFILFAIRISFLFKKSILWLYGDIVKYLIVFGSIGALSFYIENVVSLNIFNLLIVKTLVFLGFSFVYLYISKDVFFLRLIEATPLRHLRFVSR